MKAVVVHGRGDLRIEEVPDPRCGADQVVVQLEWGGICGSDIAYWKNGASGTAVLKEPLVLGHEVAGHVVEVRRSVEDVAIGSRVRIHPATLVGEHVVPPEIAGRTDLWPQVRYFGSAALDPHEAGGFSRLRAVRPDQLRALPDGVSTKEGVVAVPLSVALHAGGIAGGIAGRSVLVNGCGPIGALAVAAAKAAGQTGCTRPTSPPLPWRSPGRWVQTPSCGSPPASRCRSTSRSPSRRQERHEPWAAS